MSLADRQAALVAALVSGSPAPEGFDASRLEAVRQALLRKRSQEVAAQWPALAAGFGARWQEAFGAWARDRPPAGAWRDGWDFAHTLRPTGPAAVELTVRQTQWVGGRPGPLRKRRLPILRLLRVNDHRVAVIQLAGRVYIRRLGFGKQPSAQHAK